MFLIHLHIPYRLIDLLGHRSPIVREKVCLILSHLSTYYQGRKGIMSRPIIVQSLMKIIMRDRKELRYAAAYTLKTLSTDKFCVEIIVQCYRIIENLLKMVISDHKGIVILHLKTLQNLFEWDPVHPLKCNAFQVMLCLFAESEPRIVCGAMDCMAQLLKHPIGRELGDKNDLTFVLHPFLRSEHIEVIISAAALMQVTTLTTASKWRAKEFCPSLTKRLVNLCCRSNKPMLQLSCMQVLVNLCDCPDIRNHVKKHWEQSIIDMYIRSHEQWDGTSETADEGFQSGHYYRSRYVQQRESIKNDYELRAVNVHTYIQKLNDLKVKLIAAINWKSYRN